jgi:hypothetical protein
VDHGSLCDRIGRRFRFAPRVPVGAPDLLGLGPAFQLVEVQHDRLVRPYQIGEDLVTRARGTAGRAAILEERPQTGANPLRQDPFEIFEGGALQLPIVGVQAAKRYLERLSRQDEPAM